jgi:signal transduction histidine kinase
MNRPWKIWLVFGVCLAVLLVAMGWVSVTALRLDCDHARMQQAAELEDKVRLALWRMDSVLSPIIAQESARPYFTYRPFYAEERAYGKMFNTLAQGEVVVPSPLLTQTSSNVLLHFQFGPDGELTSPQVPRGNQMDRAEQDFAISHERIEEAAARLRRFETLMAQKASPELVRMVEGISRLSQALANGSQEPSLSQPVPAPVSAARGLATVTSSIPVSSSNHGTAGNVGGGGYGGGYGGYGGGGYGGFTAQYVGGTNVGLNRAALVEAAQNSSYNLNFTNTAMSITNASALVITNAAALFNPPVEQRLLAQQQQRPSKVTPFDQQQAARNDYELRSRWQSVQGNHDLNIKNTYANYRPTPGLNIAEGLLTPLWFGDTLVLVRRVVVQGPAGQGQEYVQGCWLDWPAIQRWLLGSVRDLLPEAHLEPIRGEGGDPQARLLAALPARLVPGPAPSALSFGSSPIVFALVPAWACMILATLAVASLLRGAVSLSERRGAFVSAVTHELRTPLTTFKMYSEMLADDMVPEPAQRRQYLETLCSEANRLSHLVENVLAYARLERGSARRRVERLSVGDLITRVKPRLAQRAEQAGMSLVEDADEQALAAMVHVDVSAVEQILFNLVDNASKYAAPFATEKVIHLEALPENGKFAMLRVRDHGQGISAEGAKRLFKPFSKSAHEAARTAPGVGLGLALCRRLSRSMGGDLRWDSLVKDGACFVLSLPVSATSAATIG